jgi:hypothetical protein
MRALLIDANDRSIRPVDMPVFESRVVAGILGCERIQMVDLGRDLLFVDEIGLLKPNPGPFFKMPNFEQPLPDKGMLFGQRQSDGEPTNCRTPLRWLLRAMQWPDIEFVGFEQFNDLVDLGDGQGRTVLIGTRAIFRPKPGRATDN